MNATLSDVRRSRFPAAIGVCATDIGAIAAMVNECTQRLIYAGGETGFWGCWRKVAFTVDVTSPYITLPRQLARAINLDVCREPIVIQNEFFEFLPGGIGLQDPNTCRDWCGNLEGYERPSVPTMVDLSDAPQLLRVYITDARDVNLSVVITGKDQNGNQIYSTSGLQQINGFVLTTASPFVTSTFTVTEIQAVQKDNSYGDIILKQVDPTTGVEVTLSRYGPTETNPSYRRYMIRGLPVGCCQQATDTGTATVTCLGKIEYIPIYNDTDQLLIANIPALIAEAQAIRMSTMDTANAAALELKYHRQAIKLLQNEQRHYMGDQRPAVTCNPFIGASLAAQGIGYNN